MTDHDGPVLVLSQKQAAGDMGGGLSGHRAMEKGCRVVTVVVESGVKESIPLAGIPVARRT